MWTCVVVGTNLCVHRQLDVKGKEIIGVGIDKEAECAHVSNIVLQWQCFVGCCVSNIFVFHIPSNE